MRNGYWALLAAVVAFAAHGGFYRVRQDGGGRWWVVAPDGGRTFLRGVDHANWNGHWCEALNVHPYREENRKRYPSQGAWEAETLDRLKSWGFNTLGAGCSPELEGRGLAHCAFLSMGESFASKGGDHALSEAQGIPGTAFPNVFHKDWEGFCDARAAQLCAGRKDDRNLVGYFFDNELYWWGRTAEEAERYFGTIAAAIRRHDPNHLLLGCRFAGLDAPRAAWEAAGRYCDIVTFNQYSWADIDENVVYTSRDSGVRAADAYEERYSWTKKPLMITEWSFPSLDSGLPCTGGAGQRFRTQAMRVKATELFARTLFALPFMVGSDYFMWVDEPELGISRKFPENSNYGLVDGCGKPYADLTAMFSRLNPEADALHERGEMPPARTVDRQAEERKSLFPEFAADSSASCVRDGDAYTLRTGAGLVLKGRVGGRAAFDSVVADGMECGPFTFMLYHGEWEDIGRVESAEWIRKAGALRIAGTGGSGGRTFRVVCDIVPIAGKPWFACNVVSAENTGTDEFADASVWLRQYSPWAADSWRTGGERSVPFLWKSPDCGAWIRSGDGAWCGAATFARTVRAFRYWISGDGATHPDAAFGEAGPLRLAPGGKWMPEGRVWMVAAAGKGGEKGWRGFLDDFAAWRDEACGSVVEVSPVEGNATPAVRKAVARLKNGDTLRFAKGEYHFFEEGAKDIFLASVGSSTGMKKAVVHLEGLKDVTVDGGGSSFVFHGKAFPFIVEKCDGVKICNFTSRVFRLPLVEFTIKEKNGAGFLCQFAKGSVPYETKDGTIFFDLDEGRMNSQEREISVHALRYCHIQYIVTAGCRCDRDKLASTFYSVAAEDKGDGKVFFRYVDSPHPKNAGQCSFPLDEPLCLLLGSDRNRSLMSFAKCRDVEVSDVDVRSGVAMGVVAEMCENIRIIRYNVRPDEGAHVSLTADSIFLVDTKGRIEIAESEICWGLDDVMNIHGNYTRLDKIDGRKAVLGIQRFNYTGYFPYRVGEKVEFSRGKGLGKQILGRAVVAEFPKHGREATRAVVLFDRDIPAEWVGCDVANVSHRPTVWIHDNYFHDFMHNRLSAFADILFERNRIRNGNVAILHDDLTGYWGECGPMHTLVARDNDCEAMRGAAFHFTVPFTGRAVLEDNRVRGGGNPIFFGPGVEKTVEVR